jgi:hypothetical protein
MSTQDVGRQEAARTTRSAEGAYDEPGGGWILFAYGLAAYGGQHRAI